MSIRELEATVELLAARSKGILAADESDGTIAKRFASINLSSTPENRRDYREMLFTTPGLNEFISGVILFEETLIQKASNGKILSEILTEHGIVPGIKVDKGTVALPNSLDEKITQGLDGLAGRLSCYKEAGARFAKWRAVIDISDVKPSCLSIRANAQALANYAAICQSMGIVPIVEPELLMDGDHSLERCAQATEKVLQEVFYELNKSKVILEGMVLKPSMVIAGSTYAKKSSVQEVADATVKILRRTVPAAVSTINFLSGGQSPEQSTANLNAMNKGRINPWNLSYSYGRALQDPALKAWGGKKENINIAQQALYKRAKLNSAAAIGEYSESME